MYDDEIDGDDMMGDDDQIVGYETAGEDVLGARRPLRRLVRRRPRGRVLRLAKKPAWRKQIAPGVPDPGQGLEPLPLTPTLNGGVFDAATPNISFQARPQAPFRAERLLTSVRRTGAAGITVLAQNIFVGRNLQMVETGAFDVEFFSPTAFGVRLNLVASQPGILIRIDCNTSAVVPALESLATSMMFLGHTIR